MNRPHNPKVEGSNPSPATNGTLNYPSKLNAFQLGKLIIRNGPMFPFGCHFALLKLPHFRGQFLVLDCRFLSYVDL